MTDFISPLRITGPSTFGGLGFGVPAADPAILALRADLDAKLHAVLAPLPAPMRAEADAIIDGYCGVPGEFYRLFYQPVWSFLHWLPLRAAEPIAPALLDAARTAQALGLFLHLWDDHLCDGQLRVDQLRLQIRTDAWLAYGSACRRLCDAIAPGSTMVEEHLATYLGAIHIKEDIADLASFCSRFERQIAIWTLVPQLLGRACGGVEVATALTKLVQAFSNAWRLIDDVQDVEADMLAGVESAVWQCLDAAGRMAWSECHARSREIGALEPESWGVLFEFLRAPSCIPHLLVQIYDWLDAAALQAGQQGWPELAREIIEHRPFSVEG